MFMGAKDYKAVSSHLTSTVEHTFPTGGVAMRPQAEVDLALRWVRWGLNDCEIARLTGISRRTILDGRHHDGRAGRAHSPRSTACPTCLGNAALDKNRYAYLLGLYLGDGMLSKHPRAYRLRIVLDLRYQRIIDECHDAIEHVLLAKRMKVGRVRKIGCMEVTAYWQHWPCLFPQHAPGPKWQRQIRLTSWQQDIASAHPALLLRGLIHSDGSRDLNYVKGKSYPRY
jgi:hypothetical protein